MDFCKVIGITGGSGSGKTTLVKKIMEITNDLALITQDNYYKSADFVNNENITAYNFDHPNAFDFDLFCNDLRQLKAGKKTEMPVYNFTKHKRSDKTVTVHPAHVIICEGIMIFSDQRIIDLCDIKVFVDTPDDIRFIRRLKRDIEERGRTVNSVTEQYLEFVRPAYRSFVEPAKEHADLIIPGGYNRANVDMLASYILQITSTSSQY